MFDKLWSQHQQTFGSLLCHLTLVTNSEMWIHRMFNEIIIWLFVTEQNKKKRCVYNWTSIHTFQTSINPSLIVWLTWQFASSWQKAGKPFGRKTVFDVQWWNVLDKKNPCWRFQTFWSNVRKDVFNWCFNAQVSKSVLCNIVLYVKPKHVVLSFSII